MADKIEAAQPTKMGCAANAAYQFIMDETLNLLKANFNTECAYATLLNDRNITGTDMSVLVALAYTANEKNNEKCFPSDNYLQKLTHFKAIVWDSNAPKWASERNKSAHASERVKR